VEINEIAPDRAIELCMSAHQRLLETVTGITDADVARPSLLPGWTVGHVLTHIARNADGHVGRLTGALAGREVARYPGGQAQRGRDIEAGARRPAAELKTDIVESNARLEAIWARSVQAGWPNSALLAGDNYKTVQSPLRRLREVEVHHVDLGLRYRADDWPDEYIDWELPWTLERLPDRIVDPVEKKRLVAWLIGRADSAGPVELKPWL
jgi:maleylpyruvate isomerase